MTIPAQASRSHQGAGHRCIWSPPSRARPHGARPKAGAERRRSIANETATCLPHTRLREPRESVQASEHLAGLNEAQRAAVEHGSGDRSGDCRPLLVIAGAGSGKTKTLAHRVANLIVHGADPRRILLLTFSRRAAAEMERRGERIAAASARRSTSARAQRQSPWSGTFHAVGARLLANTRANRPRPRIHDPRSRGLGRSDESRAPRTRSLSEGAALSRSRRRAWRSTRAQ